MPDTSSNAAHARSVLGEAIQSGIYPPGSTLPSTRELAAQFQINRNTASKIYHELARQNVIELGANRPPRVAGGVPPPTGDELHRRLRTALEPLLLECRSTGMTREQIRRALVEIADQLLASYRPHTMYIAECNIEEAQNYAQELTMRLGSIVQPILLDQLSDGVRADIIITPYFHLREARTVLGNDDQRLIGLVVTADSSDIARVASMVSRGPLGVVAINLHAAERLRRLLSFQIDVPMTIGATDQPETVSAIRDEAECVACTVRAYAETRRLLPIAPITLVQYHADDHSVQHIRRQLQQLDDLGSTFASP